MNIMTREEQDNRKNFVKRPRTQQPRSQQRIRSQNIDGTQLDVIEDGNILKYMPRVPGKDKRRKGRGTGSGHGNMSTRGSKGQGRSSGMAGAKPGFEGGQTPWYKRIPKRGFQPYKKHDTFAIRLNRLVEEMKKNQVTSVKIEDIFKILDVPLSFKKIRIYGEVETIPMVIEVECNSISEGAKISISKNKGQYQEIQPKVHSVRKKDYS